MSPLTVRQLLTACQHHPYMIVRRKRDVFAVNSKIAALSLRNYNLSGNEQSFTKIIGYRPISFQEYISSKIKFV